MKINRLMQVVFVSGSVCATVPAFAGSALQAQDPSALCGGDSDEDDDDKEEDKDGETRLCGGDSDDGDDDSDEGDEDGTETIQL